MRATLREVHLSHGRLLVAALIVTAAFDVIGSVLIYSFEQRDHGAISTFGDSLFWTTTQLLTISSQLSVPTTTGGKIVDVVLELWAILVVTTLAGSWGQFFLDRRPSS